MRIENQLGNYPRRQLRLPGIFHQQLRERKSELGEVNLLPPA
jgi:hypothetical protein